MNVCFSEILNQSYVSNNMKDCFGVKIVDKKGTPVV